MNMECEHYEFIINHRLVKHNDTKSVSFVSLKFDIFDKNQSYTEERRKWDEDLEAKI